jgi:hypothetical protein
MDQTSQTFPADLTVIGIDIGKEVFHLVGLGRDGTIVSRRKIKRLALTLASAGACCAMGEPSTRTRRCRLSDTSSRVRD